jgi:hypothetical protein|tara:strand:+ start:2837 stop:3028 length:192 start_codon:yes stop_codon:yes gene_type:complete
MTTKEEMFKEGMIKLLQEKDFKNKLIKKLNECIDIPMINEKTEKKVFNSIYNHIVNTIKEIEN